MMMEYTYVLTISSKDRSELEYAARHIRHFALEYGLIDADTDLVIKRTCDEVQHEKNR